MFLNIIGFSHLQTQKAPWQHAHQVSWCTRDCCVIQINSLILLQTSNIDNNPFSLLSRSTSGLYITSEHQKQVAVVLCHPGIIWLSAGSVLPEHPGQTQHHLLQPSASTKQRQTELCNFCINPIKEPRYALTARYFNSPHRNMQRSVCRETGITQFSSQPAAIHTDSVMMMLIVHSKRLHHTTADPHAGFPIFRFSRVWRFKPWYQLLLSTAAVCLTISGLSLVIRE